MNYYTLERILSLPKTIYVNMKCLPFSQAKKLPIYVGRKVKINNLKRGNIKIDSKDIRRKMIYIGLTDGPFGLSRRKHTYLNISNGTLLFKGNATIAGGGAINITGGTVNIGEYFTANANFFLTSKENVEIGSHVLIGWDVTILGDDGHQVLDEKGIQVNKPREIVIEDKVWIGSKTTILKGAHIGSGNIIGLGSIVGKEILENNTIIAGNPAKIIVRNRTWEH